MVCASDEIREEGVIGVLRGYWMTDASEDGGVSGFFAGFPMVFY